VSESGRQESVQRGVDGLLVIFSRTPFSSPGDDQAILLEAMCARHGSNEAQFRVLGFCGETEPFRSMTPASTQR
jgi:hypothetical protein